jgi:type I restriction enzyme S subunit
MSEWIESKLGDLVATNTASVGAGYPFEEIIYLDTGSITKGKIDGYQEFRLTDAPSRAKRLVREQDIIYSTVRPIQRHYGFVISPQENLVVSTGFVVITCKQEKLVPKYLYYYLSSDQIVEELDVIAEASTSTYPSLKPSDIENLDFRFPIDTEEQKTIASVLSSLDDKIDLLHRQNKTLEAMAETLFRQWFVEEAKVISDKKIALGDLIDTVSITHSFPDKQIIFLNTSDIYLGDVLKHETESVKDLPGQAKKSIKKDDILFSEIRPANGRYAYIDFDSDDYVVSTKLMVLRAKGIVSQAFVFFYLTHPMTLEWLQTLAEGRSGTFPQITFDQLRDLTINIPSDQMLHSASQSCVFWLKKIKFNHFQIRSLEKLRDTLLPKFMSGEVRVVI